MGSGPSKAVKEAFKHFCNGLNVAEAAKKAGCDQSTLRRHPEYIAYLKHINPSRKTVANQGQINKCTNHGG